MKKPIARGRMHFVIPDCQVKPGSNLDYLEAIGKYIVHKKPDVIVCLGDFADMESLSSWDKGKLSMEGRRYTEDVKSVVEAQRRLLAPLRKFNQTQNKRGLPQYRPRMFLTLGNHEDRIDRAISDNPQLVGALSLTALQYEEHGWEVVGYKDKIVVDGVAYSHYFPSGVMGRPIGSAQALLTKKMMSCVAGHQQGFQIATAVRGDGALLTGIIAGSCYEHDEDYLGPSGNHYWRGFLILHSVCKGSFSTQQVSLAHLKQKFPPRLVGKKTKGVKK